MCRIFIFTFNVNIHTSINGVDQIVRHKDHIYQNIYILTLTLTLAKMRKETLLYSTLLLLSYLFSATLL